MSLTKKSDLAFKRFKLNNLYITRIRQEEAIEYLVKKSKLDQSSYNCFANTHMTAEAYYDNEFAEFVNNADIVFPDGFPVAKSMRLLHGFKQERIAGMDFLPALLQECDKSKLSILFFGSTEAVTTKATKKIKEEYRNVKVKGSLHPPFGAEWDNSYYIRKINELNPNFIFVALGCPKQERWMYKNTHKIQSVMLGVGAAVPVFAGIQSRSPKWMRDNGFEWLYRLFQEPRRLFMRYFTSNFVFVYLFVRDLIKVKFG